jgi:hypothetical protein
MNLEVIPQSTVLRLIKVKYPDHVTFPHIREWCDDNCRGKWYTGHDWGSWESGGLNRCIEFTDEQDAMLFALRWT